MKTRTFSRHIFSQMLWLWLFLFVAFNLILWILSFQITEVTISSLSELEAKNLKDKSHKDVVKMYNKWEEIPLKYKKLFNKNETKEQVTLEKSLPKSEEIAYLYTYMNAQGKANYLLSIYNEKDIQKIADDIFFKSLSTIALTTLVIFTILFLMLWWLITRTAQPYKKLHTWIKSIQDNEENRPIINFSIKEIDNIALELENKIITIQAYAKREKEFLKHVSHELRTPLSIIQASLDTLNALNTNPRSHKILSRALKANNNIKITSSALLYLARESSKPIEKTDVMVETFVSQIISDHDYILKNKAVQVNFKTSIKSIHIEEDFIFVIVSNLVKNAFTYSEVGHIDIVFTDTYFSIENSISEAYSSGNDVSFALGLKLVELICQKLSYKLKITEIDNHFLVKVLWV